MAINNDRLLPNTGAALPDYQAVGPERQDQAAWKKSMGIDPESQIRLAKLAHMRYQHPDLDAITTFLQHFGMEIAKRTENDIWYRGYGPDQYVYYARQGPKRFLGAAYVVESRQDLERGAALPSAGKIEPMEDAPGGGFILTVTDPEGFPMCLIHGQQPREHGPYPPRLLYNYEVEKPRARHFTRFTPGPAAVHKLGHYGLCVRDFTSQLNFYTKHFNIVPSDFLYLDNNNNNDDGPKTTVAVFAHLDRGTDLVDHHTFFMSTNPTSHVHHCSFEVHDYDTQQLGHQWLAQQNYTPVWGVGRHILGSQIFDYWWDVSGNMIEHYADGDLVNNQTPIGYGLAGDESLAVWGPDVPKSFLD
ncbi:trihydroxytoluene oxygenase [Aspergillus sclerotiicarbonarius CBS 121057]|uniref:Trihydroxytoluene oxygenase n=1 Tax=Aspergillus sclerotiicarbonarius (strain CBS 121057 / IBT 28362) TaxID=1448318 RepID=A0A319E610_ASPSB|nr:trihydroxytoluene oxygenase [Aspergillus sclerotiicarbonarius CBS 121057]